MDDQYIGRAKIRPVKGHAVFREVERCGLSEKKVQGPSGISTNKGRKGREPGVGEKVEKRVNLRASGEKTAVATKRVNRAKPNAGRKEDCARGGSTRTDFRRAPIKKTLRKKKPNFRIRHHQENLYLEQEVRKKRTRSKRPQKKAQELVSLKRKNESSFHL